MKQARVQARQGDLLFEVVSGPPTGAKPRQNPILAYGEVTGHAHTITSDFSKCDMVTDTKGDIFVRSKNTPLVVGHDEHGAIEFPANEWICISNQREYDPLNAERERRVKD